MLRAAIQLGAGARCSKRSTAAQASSWFSDILFAAQTADSHHAGHSAQRLHRHHLQDRPCGGAAAEQQPGDPPGHLYGEEEGGDLLLLLPAPRIAAAWALPGFRDACKVILYRRRCECVKLWRCHLPVAAAALRLGRACSAHPCCTCPSGCMAGFPFGKRLVLDCPHSIEDTP